MVSAYQYRPMYPAETFSVLLSLIPSHTSSRIVLDAGCGTGFIARLLAAYVDHIDAVDISEPMIRMAKTLPGGDSPNITWINAPIETASLAGPYSLIVAAASLHWMDWERTLPHFADHLDSQGVLALVEEIHSPYPWNEQIAPIIQHYSLNKDFASYNMASIARELKQRKLFVYQNSFKTAPVSFLQPIDHFIQSYHARNGFSLDRMHPVAAAQFDAELRTALLPYCPSGIVELQISANVLWGRPMGGKV